MTKFKIIFSLIILSFFAFFSANSQTPAFPGAEGGGMYTTGGRGGVVYYVNSLADTNTGDATKKEGTLRWCLAQTGKRTILFKVSGTISLTSRLSIKNGSVTIAGQSAPGDGICLKDYDVTVEADNVIIRYMRFRMGDLKNVESDAIWGRYRNNVILDHCSMSWSVDECSSFYSNNNFTMQWCILSESLRVSIHGKGTHGFGGLWGGKNATFHHNLLAHHDSRNPRFNGWKRSGLDYTNPFDEERMDFRNNVVYNWGSKTGYGGEAAGKYNVVNNYYKAGPGTTSSKTQIIQVDIDASQAYYPRYGRFYIAGNVLHGNTSITQNNRLGVKNNSGQILDSCIMTNPWQVKPISQHSAVKAFEKVVAHAGASLSRDAVDARICNEALNGTTTYTGSKGGTKGLIDTQSDVGGWPELKSTAAPVDSNIDGIPDGWLEANYPGKKATDVNGEGYTYLEVYINSLVSQITESQNQDAVISSVNTTKSEVSQPVAFYEKTINIIQLLSPQEIRSVELLTIEGKSIMQLFGKNQTTMQIPCGNIKKGVYLLKLMYDNGLTGQSKILVN